MDAQLVDAEKQAYKCQGHGGPGPDCIPPGGCHVQPEGSSLLPPIHATVGGGLHSKHVFARPETAVTGIALLGVDRCPLLLQVVKFETVTDFWRVGIA